MIIMKYNLVDDDLIKLFLLLFKKNYRILKKHLVLNNIVYLI